MKKKALESPLKLLDGNDLEYTTKGSKVEIQAEIKRNIYGAFNERVPTPAGGWYKVVVEYIEYELSPLSYIIVNYQNSVEMYNKEKDEYHLVDDIKKDVIANVGNTRINLSTDMILFEEGERLLIKNINKLNLYE